MIQRRVETKATKTLCDLVYNNLKTQSQFSAIHKSRAKKRHSFVPVSSKLYNKNRRTIDLKTCKSEQSPIVCYKYNTKDNGNLSQSVFTCSQFYSKPKISKIALSQLRGFTPKSKNIGSKNVAQASNQKMLAYKTVEYSKKENKNGYQRQKQRLKTSKSKMSTFFSNYQRVNNYPKLQNGLYELRQEIIRENSTKFKLLENL